jgi:hypothetical protein
MVAALAVLSFTLPTQVSAQGVFIGAGATIPTGDYSDFGDGDGAKTGWMVEGGFAFPLGESGLAGFVEGLYGSNSHEHEGDKTNLLGFFGGVEMVFAEEGEAGPFIFGEIGYLRHSYKSDEHSEWESDSSGIAYGGGAGYSIPLGESLNGWVLGRYIIGHTGDDEYEDDSKTTFIGIMAGVSIPLGGS